MIRRLIAAAVWHWHAYRVRRKLRAARRRLFGGLGDPPDSPPSAVLSLTMLRAVGEYEAELSAALLDAVAWPAEAADAGYRLICWISQRWAETRLMARTVTKELARRREGG